MNSTTALQDIINEAGSTINKIDYLKKHSKEVLAEIRDKNKTFQNLLEKETRLNKIKSGVLANKL